MIDREGLRELAKRRSALHDGQSSQRKLNDDYEYIGLVCEKTFEDFIGIPMDRVDRIAGDKGRDFVTRVGRIDVKGSPTPYNLLVEEGKLTSDIYVLAGYDPVTETARLIGWEYAATLAKVKPVDFGRGVINHYVHSSKLRSMDSLRRMIVDEIA